MQNYPVDIEKIKEYLKSYNGPSVNIMEVCGSHTAAIAKYGIKTLLSDKIKLVSGPGCPVCVTTSAYIDKLIALADDYTIVTFGDLMRVPGSEKSLSMIKGEGKCVEYVYSPMDIIKMAKENPDKGFVFAAVGFETTIPVYALLIDKLIKDNITNVKILTALKVMPPVIEYLMENGAPVDAFIAPGHVCVITGSKIFENAAQKYRVPFAVAGFEGEELLMALYGLVKKRETGEVMNFYPSVVSKEGNIQAQEMIDKYFEKSDAAWRGMGVIKNSGLLLKREYKAYDAGSDELYEDNKRNKACRCDEVLMGKIMPVDCGLYGKICNPMNPQGACMVSTEGSCHTWYANS